MIRAAVGLFLATAFVTACDKLPLHENRAQFDTATSHWFANERIQYVFFSVGGLRPAQSKLTWPMGFEISTGSGPAISALTAVGKDGFSKLDLSKAVHRHRLVECGDGRVCGSFSFRTDKPVRNLKLRFRYNTASDMNELTEIPTAEHPTGQGSDSQSALVYGVFNPDNTRMQVRVHDNFGSPTNIEARAYGMDRKFLIEKLQSADLNLQDEINTSRESGTPLLFPAKVCADVISRGGGGGSSFTFNGKQGWAPTRFPSDEAASDTCFSVTMMDHQNTPLAVNLAMGRKNPELTAQPLVIHPPLNRTFDIPVVFSYCQNHSGSNELLAPEFLRYQYYILGIDRSIGVDACFATNEEDRFEKDVDRILSEKLREARRTLANRMAAGGPPQDFFFRVIIHYNQMSSSEFQKRIGQRIIAKIQSERLLISPRLAGAFVYDSRATQELSMDQSVIWCPRLAPPGGQTGDADANCVPRDGGNVLFGPLNFEIPMGPFPTVDSFLKNFRERGDRGEANDPSFSVSSVLTDANSVTANARGVSYSFLDGERISLAPGEKLKFCADRDTEQMLPQLGFLRPNDGAVLNVESAGQLLTSDVDAPSLRVGIAWTSPFIGIFSFRLPLKGKIFSIIPLSTSFNNEQRLGDPRWSKRTWNVGPLMQKCVRHCHHPYFDEAGVYQATENWRTNPLCPAPKIEEAP